MIGVCYAKSAPFLYVLLGVYFTCLVKSSWMVPLESACSVNFEYLVASVGFDIHHQVRLLSGLTVLTECTGNTRTNMTG